MYRAVYAHCLFRFDMEREGRQVRHERFMRSFFIVLVVDARAGVAALTLRPLHVSAPYHAYHAFPQTLDGSEPGTKNHALASGGKCCVVM